ncbi:hypothetical protein [Pseudoclavibacter sp. VKM Ac-2867]|uniref:hypothetical protein n=1 Tax=Pseudoclavibacter sp. VKM Ac-2867 TaxID=2783829 RepID=UPI001889EACA|nr:hypothetical protein [Pseudoclavibacter sp. VKM Ac-2867]MBF4459396.1 hypothetical protein [Pseudoclavibacter sp. VKM Ac-2867]
MKTARTATVRWAIGPLATLIAGTTLFAVPPGAAHTSEEQGSNLEGWELVAEEDFSDDFSTEGAGWVLDENGVDDTWTIDDLDDDGQAWQTISDPYFSEALETFQVYRKQVQLGADGWLTAELASVDADLDGVPDSEPSFSTGPAGSGEQGLILEEPQWNSGAVIRPTEELPEEYRIEVTLRSLDFGGKSGGSFLDGDKYNGYDANRDCMTGYPWTFKGALADKTRCEYGNVINENGFYYLAILDHANPAPHGNPGIHHRRKVIMDGYYADVVGQYGDYATCNPATGEPFSSADSNYVGLNAVFIRGDRFMKGQNYIGNEYQFETACGSANSIDRFGPNNEYSRILTSAELQPEFLPDQSYTFAVERSDDSYTIEYSGPFRHIGQATFRYTRDFVEDGIPIWHYNQEPDEYCGEFNQDLTLTGASGTYTLEDVWPAGSAYPDSFIIGDPHLNYYEGSATIDDIRLYVPED